MLVLDTETTGLKPGLDEILELAIIDDSGNVLFNHRFKNQRQDSWDIASQVNGIYPKDLANEKPLEFYRNEIQRILDEHKEIVGYNVTFDIDFLIGDGFTITEDTELIDVMETFRNRIGYRRNLSTCAKYCSYDWKETKAHGALADSLATLHCYKYFKNFA